MPLRSFQLRDATTIMGSAAETEQKMAGVTGHTEKPRLSLLLFKLLLFGLRTLET